VSTEAPFIPTDYGSEGWRSRFDGEDGAEGGAGLPLSSTSQVLENVRVVKSGAGTLFGVAGYNNGPQQFLLLIDAREVPADGAVPVLPIPIAAAAAFFVYYGSVGRAFNQGIIVCNSSTFATKTIGAANCWIDAQYV
jgi:hypothetical protein